MVWNCTRTCNLKCEHCYAQSDGKLYPQLSTEEAKAMIDDLAAFGAPVLLFSGGEPTMRPDLLELIRYAKDSGMRVVISTNGTLITKELAAAFAEVGLSYVGVSFDGDPETHDRFRGVKGSFDRAIEGPAQRPGRRHQGGPALHDQQALLARDQRHLRPHAARGINRACFYHHLVYSGRGLEMTDEDLSHEETRQAVRA